MRLTLSPAETSFAGSRPPGRRGRKPSPATQALIAAMEADRPKPRDRLEYLRVLREAGHKGTDNSATLIVNREAKRVFGKALGRSQKALPESGGRQGGRQASPATALLREKLATDKAAGELRDAKHYVRWVVDKANVGLVKARPIVYRELRAISP